MKENNDGNTNNKEQTIYFKEAHDFLYIYLTSVTEDTSKISSWLEQNKLNPNQIKEINELNTKSEPSKIPTSCISKGRTR